MFTPEEYQEIGRYFVNAIGTAQMLGHDSPATLQPYIDAGLRDSTPLLALVLDAFEATLAGYRGEAARAKMLAFAQTDSLLDAIAEAMV